MLNQENRLKSRRAFSATYNNRLIVSTDLIVLYVGRIKTDKNCPTRVGFVVSKKVHKRATKRNRIKRLMRENVRLIESKEDELEDRIIRSNIYYGENEISKSIYKISTITYKNSDYIIDTIQTIYYEDYEELKDELQQILVDVRILK